MLDLTTAYMLLASGYFGLGAIELATDRCSSFRSKRLVFRARALMSVFLGLASVAAAVAYRWHG